MRKIILLITFVFATTFSLNAQEPASIPSAPATPVVRDDNIRLRSVELERVKKEAAKTEASRNNSTVTINTEIDKKYPQIKEDFEGMQLSQAAIIKAYTTGDKIDYAMIEASADQINKNAKRLDSNLFEKNIKAISDKKDDGEKKDKEEKSLRDLIIELNGAIGDVVTSKMFLNLRVINPEIAKKTQADVMKILMLSSQLSETAKAMK